MTEKEQITAQAERITALNYRISQMGKALDGLTKANERGEEALRRLIAENDELRERLQFNEAEKFEPEADEAEQ